MPLQNIWGSTGTAYQGKYPSLSAQQRTYQQSQSIGTPYYQGGGYTPREANPLERLTLPTMEAVSWGIQAQAQIAERPVAYADWLAGGNVRRGLEFVGDIGGPAPGEPGPLGQIGEMFTGFLHKTDIATGAMLNATDANLLAALANAPMDQVIPGRRIDGGLLTFFGLGGREMTKRDFLEDLAERGWNVDPDSGRTMTWDEVAGRAKANPYDFGNAMVADNAAIDMGARMLLNPTNAIFLVPGAGQAALLGKGASAIARLGGAAARTAGWARPTATIAGASLRTSGFGVGMMQDLVASGVRVTRLPNTYVSGRALLNGETTTASLSGLGFALQQIGRGTRLLTGYKPLAGNASGLARGVRQTGNVLSAYQRGALRIQLGSVGAEFGAQGLDAAVEGLIGKDTIADAVSSALYSTLYKINNSHPLSENEAFVMFSAFAFPTVPIALELKGQASGLLHRVIGDNDAVHFARSLIPEAERKGLSRRGEAQELYRRLGEGDVALGRLRLERRIDVLDMHDAYTSMALATRVGYSLDEIAFGNAGISPLVKLRVIQMRQGNKFTAAGRADKLWNTLRYGQDGNRAVEFNVSPEYAIQWIIDQDKAMSKMSPRLAELGNFELTRAGVFTREMGDQLMQYLDASAVDGSIPRWMHNEIFRRYPGLIDHPEIYGSIWSKLGAQGDEMPRGGKPGLEPLKDERVNVEEVKAAITEMREKLPPEAELFHEARAMEAAAPEAPTIPSSLRDIHSVGTLNQMRADSTGQIKALARDARALAHIRNAEFTRNGKPKFETIHIMYGYAGARFNRKDAVITEALSSRPAGPELLGRTEFTFEAWEGGSVLGYETLRIYDDGRFHISALEPSTVPIRQSYETGENIAGRRNIGEMYEVTLWDKDTGATHRPAGETYVVQMRNKDGVWEQAETHDSQYSAIQAERDYRELGKPVRIMGQLTESDHVRYKDLIESTPVSEAIVKAVQLGARTIRIEQPDAIIGAVLARHGFVEVARVKGSDVAHYAFVGGSPEKMPSYLHYPIASKVEFVWPDVVRDPGGGTTPMMIKPIALSQDVQMVSIERLLENAETHYTIYRGDFEGTSTRPMTTKDPLVVQVKYDNSALEVYWRLAPEQQGRLAEAVPLLGRNRQSTEQVPVILEHIKSEAQFGVPTYEAMGTAQERGWIAFFKSIETTMTEPQTGMVVDFVSAAELMGDYRSPLPAYKPSKRLVGDTAAARMAEARAGKASLTVPSMEAIGTAPTKMYDTYHGSGHVFEQFLEEFQAEQPFVGRGFYLTSDAGVALSYAVDTLKDTFRNSTLYRAEIKPGTPLLDLMGPMPDNLKAEFRRIIEDPDNAKGLGTHHVSDLLNGLETASSGIEFILNWNQGWTAKTRFDVKTVMGEVPFASQMRVSNMFRDAAEAAGFKGYTHEGNVFSMDPANPHEVTVVFREADVKVIDKIPTEEAVPATGARFKQITDRLNATRDQTSVYRATIADLDRRAAQLRTVKVSDIVSDAMPPERVLALRELMDEVHRDMPMYDIEYKPGFIYDPADGVIGSLNLERNLARHVLFDYGPMSKITSLYNALFKPLASKNLSGAARHAMFAAGVRHGITVKEMEAILTALNRRQREQTLGPMRSPWFRDITSLPPVQINTIVKALVSDEAWKSVESRYGKEGFHRLMDEAANEFTRRTDNTIRRGGKPGGLQRAMREFYRGEQYLPVVGATGRFIHKQFYHIFRFQLDLRWHFLNLVEADILGLFTTGRMRWGAKEEVGPSALLAHTGAEGLPIGVASSMPGSVTGPAHAMELFDAGLYLHNRNLLPVLERNFDVKRIESVNTVLDSLPVTDPIIKALVERFGADTRTWSRQLDDMMYAFDTRGVSNTVHAEAKKIAADMNWTPEEIQLMAPLLNRIADLNQRAYDDLIGLYTGNLNRTRAERMLNSYWLYWPISYQIKATKWLLSWMLTRTAGKRTNMGTAWLIDQRYQEFFDQISNDQNFAKEFDENREMWFVAGMFMPTTPFDTGVSLNRGVRYVGSLLAPNLIQPYVGVDGPEDVPIRMLELGPMFTVRIIQSAINELKEQPSQRYVPPKPLPLAPLPGL